MSALYQKQTKTTSRPHSLTCCKRLASQAFIAKVTAAFSSSPVAPSRASVDRPVSTLCRYLASACAFVSAASSPEPVALRTHFRNPSRIRLRRASRSLRICSCPGEQVLTDNAIRQPLGCPCSVCIVTERRNASSMASRGARLSSHRQSFT